MERPSDVAFTAFADARPRAAEGEIGATRMKEVFTVVLNLIAILDKYHN